MNDRLRACIDRVYRRNRIARRNRLLKWLVAVCAVAFLFWPQAADVEDAAVVVLIASHR